MLPLAGRDAIDESVFADPRLVSSRWRVHIHEVAFERVGDGEFRDGQSLSTASYRYEAQRRLNRENPSVLATCRRAWTSLLRGDLSNSVGTSTLCSRSCTSVCPKVDSRPCRARRPASGEVNLYLQNSTAAPQLSEHNCSTDRACPHARVSWTDMCVGRRRLASVLPAAIGRSRQ